VLIGDTLESVDIELSLEGQQGLSSVVEASGWAVIVGLVLRVSVCVSMPQQACDGWKFQRFAWVLYCPSNKGISDGKLGH